VIGINRWKHYIGNMAKWSDNPEVFLAMDEWLCSQQKPLNNFMEHIMPYADDSPHWGMIVVYAKFVMNWSHLKQMGDMTETELFNECVARIANDPLTQNLMASMMGGMMNRGVGLE